MFDVEHFEWAGEELRLRGRWTQSRRFRRIRLVAGEERIAPLTQLRGEEGRWAAVFPWDAPHPPAEPWLEVGQDALRADLPAPVRLVALATGGAPRAEEPPARPVAAIDLPPRQPEDPVRGEAPLAVRAIAIALCSGVVIALLIVLSAIF